MFFIAWINCCIFAKMIKIRLKNTLKTFFGLLVGLLIVFVGMELLLRVYNPLEFSVRRNKIILRSNQTFTYQNKTIPNLDSTITVRKNNLGFRGDDLPKNNVQYLKIITTGSSTTECAAMNEGDTWTDRTATDLKKQFPNQKIWINNAGLNGFSTYGTILLMKDYLVPLKPDFLVLMVGAMDLSQKNKQALDQRFATTQKGNKLGNVLFNLANHSELISTVMNLKSMLEKGNQASVFRGKPITQRQHTTLSDTAINQLVLTYDQSLKGYAQRLDTMVDLCKKNNIEPIFMTCPTVYGIGTDSLTNVNLETLDVYGEGNAKAEWQILERYNDLTRQVCIKNGLTCIDLARIVPKSSLYFYDHVHFNALGCRLVGEIVADTLSKKINKPKK